MRRSLLITLGGILLLSLTGCTSLFDRTYTTPSDTSAEHLSMYFTAQVVDATSWFASAAFSGGSAGVRFAKGEQVACEGITLSHVSEDSYFSKTLPLKPHGASYDCTYTTPQQVTSWRFVLPDAVQVTAPLAGDTLDRTNATIRYTGAAGVGIVVGVDNGDPTGGASVAPKKDAPGIYQFSASPPLAAGAGRLIVHSIRVENAKGFANAQINEDVGTTIIPVIWT